MNLGHELQGLVGNVNELVDSLVTIRSHVETSLGSLPVATGKLDKVTGETESAAQHLMDVLDGLNENDKAVADVLVHMSATAGASGENSDIVRKLSELLDKNQAAHLRMLEILQFQDLTSQQINHVASLLEKIEMELNAILGVFGERGHGVAAAPARAFNEAATYKRESGAQSDVDELIRAIKKEKA